MDPIAKRAKANYAKLRDKAEGKFDKTSLWRVPLRDLESGRKAGRRHLAQLGKQAASRLPDSPESSLQPSQPPKRWPDRKNLH
jgi:hypothetical protein